MTDTYECEDCGTPYLSPAAVAYCDCDKLDNYGRPKPIRGHDWLP